MMVNIRDVVFWDVTPRSKRGTNVSNAALKMVVEDSSESLYVCTKPHGITPKKTNFMRHVLDSVLAYLIMLFQLSRT
jgi:hypothetical protein